MKIFENQVMEQEILWGLADKQATIPVFLWKRNRCNKREEFIDEITKVAESMASGKIIKEFYTHKKTLKNNR